MFKFLLACCLISLPILAHSAVRFNPYTGLWEGNICANQYAWTYLAYQPIGSFCQFRLPTGQIMQGVIINQ